MQRLARDVLAVVEGGQDHHLALATFLVCRTEEVITTVANLSPTVRVVGLSVYRATCVRQVPASQHLSFTNGPFKCRSDISDGMPQPLSIRVFHGLKGFKLCTWHMRSISHLKLHSRRLEPTAEGGGYRGRHDRLGANLPPPGTHPVTHSSSIFIFIAGAKVCLRRFSSLIHMPLILGPNSSLFWCGYSQFAR